MKKEMNQDTEVRFDAERAKRALLMLKQLRASRVFDKGESSDVILRRWRDNRR